jgi:hypothetical protein
MVKRKFEEIIQENVNDDFLGAATFCSFTCDGAKKVEFNSTFFEEASKAWKANKIEKENSTYKYKCTFRNKKKIRCNRPLYEYELNSKNKPYKENCEHFCKMHIYKIYNPEIHTFC